MSFIKITSKEQRDALAKSLHDVKQNIKASQLKDRLDKRGVSRDLGRFFKPVVETQEKAALENSKNLPLPPPIPALPPPPDFADPLPTEEDPGTILGPRAQHYLQMSMTNQADHTFGLWSENGGIFIGNAPVNFDGDNLLINGQRYKWTPGLWELMVMKRPEDFEMDDLETYGDILKKTYALYQNNSALSKTPKSKSNRSFKWKAIVSHIYDEDKKGSGMLFLASDPTQLTERLDLCTEAFKAGNTGVRNEIVAILDALRSGKYIDNARYKRLHRDILK